MIMIQKKENNEYNHDELFTFIVHLRCIKRAYNAQKIVINVLSNSHAIFLFNSIQERANV